MRKIAKKASDQVFVQISHPFLQLWGFDVWIRHPHHHHTPIDKHKMNLITCYRRLSAAAAYLRGFWKVRTCPAHQRNWFPRSSSLRPQRTIMLLWVRRRPAHTSKSERETVSTRTRKPVSVQLWRTAAFTWMQWENSPSTCSTWLAFFGSWNIWERLITLNLDFFSI